MKQIYMKLAAATFLLGSLLACAGLAKDERSSVTTVKSVDINAYLGKWYEVASIPQSFQKQCVGNTTAEYSMAEHGRVKVLNSCDTKEGKRNVAQGRAKIVDQQTNAKLKVTFVKLIDWNFLFGGNYWILELGANYSYAVVGDPTRQYAWILSRTPSLDIQTLAGIESRLKKQGYDTSKILSSIQSEGYQTRESLSKLVAGALDIVDIAAANGNFKTLLTAVQHAGLENTLRSKGPFTVFAPTDAAFSLLGEATLKAVLADKNLLTQILTFHVVPGFLTSTDVVRLGSFTTINGKSLTLNIKDGAAYINNSKLVITDVPASNGIVHVIDAVLVP